MKQRALMILCLLSAISFSFVDPAPSHRDQYSVTGKANGQI